MKAVLFDDIVVCLKDKRSRWLNVCVALYMLFLPFNAFEFSLPGMSFLRLKATKITMFLAFALWVVSIIRDKRRIICAPLLYAGLAISCLANFLSVFSSANPRVSLVLAVLMVPYSLMVVCLVNALQDRRLLNACMVCLGIDALILGAHSLAVYLRNGLVFHTRYQQSIVGNEMAHYLAYALFLTGAALLAVYFRERHAGARRAVAAGVCLWLFVSILPAVKIFHLATLLFFIVLFFLTPRSGKVPLLGFFVAFAVSFFLLLNIVTIRNFFIRQQQTRFTKSSVEPGCQQAGSERAYAGPQLIVEETTANAVKNRWQPSMVAGSFEIRARGILAGIAMGLDHPFLGIGIGETPRLFDGYSERVRRFALDKRFFPDLPLRERILNDAVMTSAVTSIFNIFFNALAETGFPGLAGLIMIVVAVIGACIAGLKRRAAEREGDDFVLPVFFSLFLGLLLVHQSIYLWMHPWLWTVIGITYAASKR